MLGIGSAIRGKLSSAEEKKDSVSQPHPLKSLMQKRQLKGQIAVIQCRLEVGNSSR